jgi:uncharacterized protein (DUF58 family)
MLSWFQRRPRRRLRTAGGALLVTTFLVLLAAGNTGENLLYVILAGMVSLQVISALLARLNMRGLRVTRNGPRAVHRGELCPITVSIQNSRRWWAPMGIRIERAPDPTPRQGWRRLAPAWMQPGDSLGYVFRIPPRRTAVVRVDERMERRGPRPLPPMVLVSTFPFGFSEVRVPIVDKQEVLVYPRVRPVRLGRIEHNAGTGVAPRHELSEGDEFHSLREYMPGDDLRKIAWRLSARFGHFVVKELEVQTSRHVVLAFDTTLEDPAEPDDRFEAAVELTASLAVNLIDRSYVVSLQTPRGLLQEGEGRAHVIQVLDMLARIEPTPPPSGPGALAGAVSGFGFAHIPERATAVFISPDPSRWGMSAPAGGSRIVDPREVLIA